MKILFKIALGIIALIAIILLATVQIIDRTPYQEMAYYKDWKSQIQAYELPKSDTTQSIKVGWAKANFTPETPTAMAGYGKRRGAHYESVHDSIYVRTIILSNGSQKSALVSADLLIIPPSVSQIVKQRIAETGLAFSDIYFSATHSHSSLGGWYDTVVGKLFAGAYDPEVEKNIAEAIINAIKSAAQNLSPAVITFEKDLDTKDIRNRLMDGGEIAPFIRTLTFKTATKKAVLTTYAAHSTVLNASTLSLSRDFPGVLVDSLENTEIDFAMYMAGAVGSMGPQEIGDTDFDEVNNQALGILHELRSENEYEQQIKAQTLNSFQLDLPLRKPSPKLTKNLALKPWVFRWAFGDAPNFVKVLKIGNTLMVGLPCDFSGELMKELDEYASKKGLNLIITSFNGAYAGYITADVRFDLDKYETTTMSWFGPYNGDYFSEVVRDIIDKVVL